MIGMKLPLALALLSLGLVTTGLAAPSQLLGERTTSELSLTAQLTLADRSAVDRYNLLNDSDYVYDFKASPFANRKTFPALVGAGVGFAFAKMPACTYAPLHIHPRANELLFVASGKVTNYMIPELGVSNADGSRRVIVNELSAGEITLNPQGSYHTIYNFDCEPVLGAAAFSNEDQGINPVSSSLFTLPDEQIMTELGGNIQSDQITAIRSFIMSGNLALEECKAKCGSNSTITRH